MRILHTSDWHLGKRLFDRDRLPEQEKALDFLVQVCEREAVDLVLVAGDVFDTFLPPAEAEELFFRSVKRLAGEKRAVVIISGNHDDGVRLASSAPLAAGEGVYIFGGKPFALESSSRPVRALEAGENYAVIGNAAGERVYINALPYPNEARLKEEKTEESYPEKVARWIAKGDAHYRGDMPHILLAHLFVAGGQVSESERSIELGGARAVPVSVFPGNCYVALGHLHRRQTFGEARYPGSLLQYSFDENPDKCVYLLETEGITVKEIGRIPVEGGKKLIRLEANSPEDGIALLQNYGGDCLIELTLHLGQPLSRDDLMRLKEAHGGLVHTIPDVAMAGDAPLRLRSRMSDEELFTEFCKSRFSKEPDAALKEMFLKLLAGEE